jgi:hypothetical protein
VHPLAGCLMTLLAEKISKVDFGCGPASAGRASPPWLAVEVLDRALPRFRIERDG